MERHVELWKEREKLERMRLGTAAAAVMNTGMATKEGGGAFMPWDVFPELQPAPPADVDPDVEGIRAMFREKAARIRAQESIDG